MERSNKQTTPLGPLAGSRPQEVQLETKDSKSVSLLCLPEATNAQRAAAGLAPIRHAVLATPTLARNSAGHPDFSMTLILSRQPQLGETSLEPLIERGLLSLGVNLQPPSEVLRTVAKVEYRTLFSTTTHFMLASTANPTRRFTAEASGTTLRASISADLTRDEALDVLQAIAQDSGTLLRVECRLRYRAWPARESVRLYGDWAKIHDALAAVAAPTFPFTKEDLFNLFTAAVTRGLITMSESEDMAAAFPTFLRGSAVILQRLTPDLLMDDPANRYELRSRPPDGTPMRLGSVMTSAIEEEFSLAAGLGSVIGDAIAGQSSDAYLHAVAPDGQGGIAPVPRRVRQVATSDAPKRRPPEGSWDPGREEEEPPPESLPVVDDPQAPLWADRLDTRRTWYAPEFRVLVPEPATAVANSPFVFRVTFGGHDATGRLALDAEIRIALEQVMGIATLAAWEQLGRSPMTWAVPIDMLSAVLELPFRDEKAQTIVQRFPADSEQINGTVVTAVFRISDNWARLCYGALAYKDFQMQPARISVRYLFRAYDGGSPEPYWAVKTVVCDLLFPCDRLGAFYVQVSGSEEAVTIGCQEAFRLGQTELRQYQLLDAAEFSLDRRYRVYRSLQRPGRFLIVPSLYQIGRFGPDEGDKAYRPDIFLYSTIDAQDSAKSWCVILATLQPDLPAWTRRELLEKLRRLHPTPSLEYITEIESDYEIEWSLPSTQRIQIEAVKQSDSFQVTLTTAEDSVLQVRAILERSGIAGLVRFVLPDGSILQTDLRISLETMVGPWASGPVEAELTGSVMRLTNRVERSADVSEVRCYAANTALGAVPVGQSLAAGGTWDGQALSGTTDVLAACQLASGSASLPEIRSFLEDIHTNIVFVNQVNYTAHQLKRLIIQAQVADLSGKRTFPVDESATADMNVLLPLTSYLANPTLQFQVALTFTDDHTATSDLVVWQLSSRGHVIGLTWDLIKPTGT